MKSSDLSFFVPPLMIVVALTHNYALHFPRSGILNRHRFTAPEERDLTAQSGSAKATRRQRNAAALEVSLDHRAIGEDAQAEQLVAR